MDRMNRCMSEEAKHHSHGLCRAGQGRGEGEGKRVNSSVLTLRQEGRERRLQTGSLFPRAPRAADGFHGHWE